MDSGCFGFYLVSLDPILFTALAACAFASFLCSVVAMWLVFAALAVWCCFYLVVAVWHFRYPVCRASCGLVLLLFAALAV